MSKQTMTRDFAERVMAKHCREMQELLEMALDSVEALTKANIDLQNRLNAAAKLKDAPGDTENTPPSRQGVVPPGVTTQ